MRGQDTTAEFYICNFPFIFDPIAKVGTYFPFITTAPSPFFVSVLPSSLSSKIFSATSTKPRKYSFVSPNVKTDISCVRKGWGGGGKLTESLEKLLYPIIGLFIQSYEYLVIYVNINLSPKRWLVDWLVGWLID